MSNSCLLEQPLEPIPPEAADGSGPSPGRAVRLSTRQDLFDRFAGVRGLDERTANPAAGWEWTAAALETVDRDRSLRAVALVRAGRLEAVAPLVLARRAGLATRVLTGVGRLHEPADFAAVDRHALAELVHAVVRDRRPLLLERIWADSPTLELLRSAAAGRGRLFVRPQASCPYIELTEAWRDPLAALNAGRRSDMRRALRKAEAEGPIRTEIISPCGDDVTTGLEQALRIEQRSWKGAAGTALLADPARAQFYRDYCRRAAQAGQLRLAFWSIGGQRVAMQIAIERGGGWWLLKVGYDEKYAFASPGQWLMAETIGHAIRHGLSRYEFLGRAEKWTQVWTKTERPTVSVRFYPWSIRGLAGLAADGISAGVRLAIRRNPPTSCS